MKTKVAVATLYVLFAAFSTVINIGTQFAVFRIYAGPYPVEVSMVAGTVAGLPLRYLLEKRYIFQFKSNNLQHDGWLFMLYSMLGVITTAIFWGVEYAFHWLFNNETMRYVGGVLGLSVGFYVKYQLDKRYVFQTPQKAQPSHEMT